jgi:(2R)-3-sulfolactate dehydrogenase (NADP+)
MVEILASFFTDSAMSLHTSNLQATVGPPHGLGIFCLLLDPTAIAGDAFERKLDILQTAVQAQPGTRLPGTGKSKQSRVAVNSLLWERAQILAGA